MAEVELKLTQRLKTKLFFDDEDMDFDFQLFLANLEGHGAAIGEIFNTARRIDTKDELSWKTEFVKEAERVEALAENCLNKGHRISAGDAFLRAFTYYDQLLWPYHPRTPTLLASIISLSHASEGGSTQRPN